MSRKLQPEQMDYNLEVGPVLLNVSAALGNGYTANLGLTQSGGQGSATTTPSLTMNMMWPITDLNTLTFGLTGSYAYYWNASESNSPGGLTIAPTSALQGTFYAGDFRITPYDQFSVQNDPTQAGELSNVSRLTLYQNSIGLKVDWDLSDIIVTAGFDNFDLLSGSDQFRYLERNTMTPSLAVTYWLTKTIIAGIQGVAAITSYDSHAPVTITPTTGTSSTLNGQNNNTIYQVGPFVSTRLSEYISMSGQVGYVWGQFTGSETAGNQAGGNPSTFFLNGGVDHRVNQFLNYSLTASRSTQLSATVGQNYVEVWLFNLSPSWKIIDKMTISTPLSVTFGQQSGTLNAETYQTYSASASLGYKLTEKLGSSVNFSYLIKNSDQNSGLQNGSYNQWNAALNFSYDF